MGARRRGRELLSSSNMQIPALDISVYKEVLIVLAAAGVEASQQLSEAVLTDIGVSIGPVIASIHEKRAAVQAEIRAIAPEAKIRKQRGRRLRE
jgi:hypothetical protein